MHIAHIQGIFSPEHGGPAQSLGHYCRTQASAGHRVSVWALDGLPHSSPAIRLPAPVEMHVCRVDPPARLGCSREMRRQLLAAESADLYHLHGAWLRAMHYGAVAARRQSKPYLLELMGMYEDYALRQKGLQKRLARWFYQDAVLRGAACLHANSLPEAQGLRRLGFRNPIAVVPVGVDTGSVARLQAELGLGCPWPELQGRPFVLFLSRIHPKKGLELLLQAWSHFFREYPEHRLLVAGTGEGPYVQSCQQIASDLGVSSKVFWAGHVTEAQRCWAYTHAACYVLPTYSENFGNTVAEALAHGTPVLTTSGTPWLELPREGCGWIASPSAASITGFLGKALAISEPERRAMGEAGRRLVERRYSLAAVIQDLDAIYHWVTKGGSPPACVELG